MPSWKEFERFLIKEGWVLVRENGRDKRYEKVLPNGEILTTSVSKGTGEIGKGLFRKILKQQVRCSKEYY
ncbi:MAG: type II toxin-antitoxin system HicA family toxin [Bacilli bacterium]